MSFMKQTVFSVRNTVKCESPPPVRTEQPASRSLQKGQAVQKEAVTDE